MTGACDLPLRLMLPSLIMPEVRRSRPDLPGLTWPNSLTQHAFLCSLRREHTGTCYV